LIALLANYVTVVKESCPQNIVAQFQSSTFGHNSPILQRDFSALAELLVSIMTQSACSLVLISS